MNEPEPVSDLDRRTARPVFISYATSDARQALAVCKAIERRGMDCWIATRDVAPGENYQEAIVAAIRDARAMVLIFSKAANHSNEIKKELSLASRYHVPVIALRTEDVEPSDAFAYELSTRQWVDGFKGRDKAVDSLVGRIGQLPGASPVPPAGRSAAAPGGGWSWPRWMAIPAATLLLIALAGAAWWLAPRSAAAHSMTVRLAGFRPLSAGLPATLPDTVDAEIAAAFNADGVVGVSTAGAPPAGTAPAYALGGTIQRDGDTIRVITRLANERSGATLWSGNFNYDAREAADVPRHVAVDAGNVVRCGLFGASTYRKPLPDNVLRDYVQFCQGHWDPQMSEGRKALVPAQRVVAAVPNFSWGWAAVAAAYWKVAMGAEDSRTADEARASGREAADRAVAIDARNSEALYVKSLLVDRQDWLGREGLLKRAVAARRLDCGCEHHQYGELLAKVGRTAEAIEQLRQANDMLALYVYTPLSLANVLIAAGKAEEARPYVEAAIKLAPDAEFANELRALDLSRTGEMKGLVDARSLLPPQLRDALLQGYRAAGSGDPAAKLQAARALDALPADHQGKEVALLLGQLGANEAAFRIAARLAGKEYPGPSLFWYRSMRGTLDNPGFPALAEQLGLMRYWKASGTRPDVCLEKAAPPFCRLI